MKFFRVMSIFLITGALLAGEKTISLDVQNADIKTVLRAFSDVAGVNIVTTPDVKANVTFSVKNVPWREAFTSLLNAYSLAYTEQKNIITVMTQDEYSKVRDIAGLEMKVFRVKYLKASDVAPVVESLLSSRGKMKVESSTNSLVITDLPDNLIKIENFLNGMDRPERQVQIQVKVVEVDYDAARSLGINWVVAKDHPTDKVGVRLSNDASIGGAQTNLSIGTIVKGISIDNVLQALENESKANIVSAPSIMVANNNKAKIVSGKKVPVVTKDISGNTVVQFFDAAIKLEVTPHITPDGNIAMELHPQVSDIAGYSPAGQPIISNQEAETKLTIKNGETIVLGGVVKQTKRKGNAGFPFLRKIPVINLLFSSNENASSKVELMVFVTPKIVGDEAMNTLKSPEETETKQEGVKGATIPEEK